MGNKSFIKNFAVHGKKFKIFFFECSDINITSRQISDGKQIYARNCVQKFLHTMKYENGLGDLQYRMAFVVVKLGLPGRGNGWVDLL